MSTGNSDIEINTESDDDGYYDYYNDEEENVETDSAEQIKFDPEYFEFKCLTVKDVETFLNDSVETLCASLHIQITPSLAKILLKNHSWATSEIISDYKRSASKLLIQSRIKPEKPLKRDTQVRKRTRSRSLTCCICLLSFTGDHFCALACGHYFCKDCWSTHFEIQIVQGIATTMECMGQDCNLLVPEDFVLSILDKPSLREKYQEFLFSDYVKSHPQLRFCPGPDCDMIIFAKDSQSKRVTCTQCKVTFCFKCGTDYHAPNDCDTIKKWITKCADDSETANYISAYTKDCPKCNVCIEKNGGCNHMVCTGCKFDFCWICLRGWNTHNREYYGCNKYNEDKASTSSEAREALKKYLFYFERWENHARSLRLEQQTLQKIKERIEEKVMANEGTWIDWQYLKDAADLLAKCRYTLQYTYPCAYYMESGPRKELFEYQQAKLEAEIENLSWKVERAESTDRGDLENQMDIAEKRRSTLLKDFSAI